eukprot:m.1405893 g.1405893  ORF g.1405893 m.1405893 type:complete len:75 (+) comp25012_c0_seq107:421-645(+)
MAAAQQIQCYVVASTPQVKAMLNELQKTYVCLVHSPLCSSHDVPLGPMAGATRTAYSYSTPYFADKRPRCMFCS